MKFNTGEIAKAIDGKLDGCAEQEICGISIDSRTITKGQCFFSIKGDNFDGHSFCSKAIENGADCLVVQDGFSQLPENIDSSITIIKVKDTTTALAKLACHYRNKLDCKVVSITGSVGKTTTRDILSHVVSKKFKTHSAKKSFNNHIGLPLTILEAPLDTEVLITELGSNNPGEIELLTKISQPNIALITKVCPAHLEGFGSIENIIKEKSAIASGLKEDGKLIVNGACTDLVSYLETQDLLTITFALERKADIKPENFGMNGTQSWIEIDGVHIDIPLAGLGNIENTLAALAVARQLGLSAELFSQVLSDLEYHNMRMDIISLPQITLIADCYNANPGSMKNAIATLNSVSDGKRAVFICGTMGELGSQSETLHEELGNHVASSKIAVLLGVGQDCSHTVSAAKASKPSIETGLFKNTDELCNNLHLFLKPDDIVLVKGSRSVALELALERIKELFPAD